MTIDEIAEEMKANPNAVFVFGSNSHGRHNKGAALTAKELYGAKFGVAKGPTGRCYAIPTRNWLDYRKLVTRSLADIRPDVEEFLDYAREHPETLFLLCRVGCGYAGYKPQDIAPLFATDLENVVFPDDEWLDYAKNGEPR
jgi:hypothetical protein